MTFAWPGKTSEVASGRLLFLRTIVTTSPWFTQSTGLGCWKG